MMNPEQIRDLVYASAKEVLKSRGLPGDSHQMGRSYAQRVAQSVATEIGAPVPAITKPSTSVKDIYQMFVPPPIEEIDTAPPASLSTEEEDPGPLAA